MAVGSCARNLYEAFKLVDLREAVRSFDRSVFTVEQISRYYQSLILSKRQVYADHKTDTELIRDYVKDRIESGLKVGNDRTLFRQTITREKSH